MPASPPLLREDATTWSYRLAHGLAYVVSPLVWPPLLYGLVPAHFGAPAAEVTANAVIALLFFALVPMAYVAWLVRGRRVASLEVRARERRTVPFLVAAASSVVAVLLLYGTGATAVRLVAALGACHVANLLVVIVINLRWKISIHTTALAGFVSILYFVATTGWAELAGVDPAARLLQPIVAAGVLPLLPVLMWARVRTGAHTRPQVAAGALLGLVLPFAELYALWRLGWLGAV